MAPSGLAILAVAGDRPGIGRLRSMLLSAGHAVSNAEGLNAILRSIKESRPSAVLLPLDLRPETGFEVARHIRLVFGPMPVLVALVGENNALERKLAMRAGFDHCVAGDCSLHELRNLMTRIGEALS